MRNDIKKTIILISTVLSILFSIPTFLGDSYKKSSFLSRVLPNTAILFGLDLKGGISLLAEIDDKEYFREDIQKCINQISQYEANNIAQHKADNVDPQKSTKFTKFKLFVDENDKYGFTFEKNSKESDIKELKNIVNEYLGQEYDIEYSNSETVKITLNKKYIEQKRNHLLHQAIDIIKRRIDENGTKSIEIQKYGDIGILIQIPGIEDATDIKKILNKTAKLTFHIVNGSITKEKLSLFNTPFGIKYMPLYMPKTNDYEAENNDKSLDDKSSDNNENEVYYVPVDIAPLMFGDVFMDVQPINNMGNYAVNFKLNSVGSKIFAEITQNNVGRLLAIILDDNIISCPSIREAINDGNGSISGNFSRKTATELALLLRSGAMPVKLKVIEEKVVGPSLGYRSTVLGIKAITFAGISISAMMVIIYGYLGLLASLGLFLNFLMLISFFGIMGITMTLPGLAGIALTLGMAIDANVLIFERMKEEIRKSPQIGNQALLEKAHDRAIVSILDSNITTVLISLILYLIGSNLIRGFAITILIGILCSFFTSVVFTKYLIEIFYKRKERYFANEVI